MIIFILAGVYATSKLSTRLFPEFEINLIGISISQDSISANDVEQTLLVPAQNALRSVSGYSNINGYAYSGTAEIYIEFPSETDMEKALEDVKNEIDQASFPSEAKEPRVTRISRTEQISKLSLSSSNRDELKEMARKIERNLNAAGIGKVDVSGIPEQEILIRIDQGKLTNLGLTLDQVGKAIREQNVSASIGDISGLGNSRKLRTLSKTSSVAKLSNIPINASDNGNITYLRDIAQIERVAKKDQVELLFNGRPAVEFNLASTGKVDVLTAAADFEVWLEQARQDLPAAMLLETYDRDYKAIEARRDLLIKNGLGGLALVLLILYIFLSGAVAFWVAAGIPIAMFATLFVFQYAGGSFNMISMFALIMATGIIVDDAIVVGENAQYRLEQGAPPLRAVLGAAKTMFVPVFASSFTTVAAFLPLLLIDGSIGDIIFDIPLVIICILIAALLECFLILPGHLYHSFANKRNKPIANGFNQRFERIFTHFREEIFRPVVTLAVRHSIVTVAICFVILAICANMIRLGFVEFEFFPGSEQTKITATVEFVDGTPRNKMEEYLTYVVDQLVLAEQAVGGEAGSEVSNVITRFSQGGGRGSRNGDQKASLDVILIDPTLRDYTTNKFSEAWEKNISVPPEVTKLKLRSARGGGGNSQGLEVVLTGADIHTLKNGSLLLQEALRKLPEINSVSDDTPASAEQLNFELTSLGKRLGVSTSDVSNGLGNSLDGFLVQTFTENVDEVQLRVLLEDKATTNLLSNHQLQLENGNQVQLADVVNWYDTHSYDVIIYQHGLPSIQVSAKLITDAKLSTQQIINGLNEGILKQLRTDYGIEASFSGDHSDQKDVFSDMATGLVLTLLLTFIILTTVFNSWSLPLVIMVTMPLGIIGTIIGHWLMGISMSILSFFGMFTLMGIIVNDSIVLVRCYIDLREDTDDPRENEKFIVETACLRLRAVLLTSLTTTAGLMPLMFETSLQAQFLIPMAVSICFGLAFATFLILLFTPACIAIQNSIICWHKLNKRLPTMIKISV